MFSQAHPLLFCVLSSLLQVLASNSGYDPMETLVKLQTEYKESGQLVGVDLNTGQQSHHVVLNDPFACHKAAAVVTHQRR